MEEVVGRAGAATPRPFFVPLFTRVRGSGVYFSITYQFYNLYVANFENAHKANFALTEFSEVRGSSKVQKWFPSGLTKMTSR